MLSICHPINRAVVKLITADVELIMKKVVMGQQLYVLNTSQIHIVFVSS